MWQKQGVKWGGRGLYTVACRLSPVTLLLLCSVTHFLCSRLTFFCAAQTLTMALEVLLGRSTGAVAALDRSISFVEH